MPPKTAASKTNTGDIRSFFTSISSKTPPSSKTSSKNEIPKEDGGGKRKKKVMVISDSDSDEQPVSPRKVSKQKTPEKSKTKLKQVATIEKIQSVDAKSIFGDAPIRRSNETHDKRKRKLEEHSDEDFNATLKQLDESPPKRSKLVEEEVKTKKKQKTSPVKKETTKLITPTKNGKSPKKVIEETKKNVEEMTKLVDVKKKGDQETSKSSTQTIIIKQSPENKQPIPSCSTSSPSVDPLEKRKMQAENYRRFLASHRDGAKNPGSKPIPEGAEGCLEGLTIVVTGVLDSLQREEAEGLVKKYGGKATHAISHRTSYLLAGDDAGPAKLNKAKDFKIPIINEDDFLNMIATRPAKGTPSASKVTTPKSDRKPKVVKVKDDKLTETKEKEKKKTPIKMENDERAPDIRKIATDVSSVKHATDSDVALPWVDKYKPQNIKQIIGQQGEKSNAKKLYKWLEHWYSNRSGNKKLIKPSPWATNDDGSYFKAALLSGPPGIGKTTTAHLVCKELGYDVVEMNASDTRSKKLLEEEISELLSSQSLAAFAHGSVHTNGKKRVLIMDEVDGMAGTEDRGGVQELISLIKRTKIPIICICNDRQHPKVRSLSNYCFDLRYSKPRVEQIRGAMMSICYKEGIKLKPEALDEIIVGANQDVRQILHHLSVLSAKQKNLSTEEAKKEASKSRKDMKLGPWDVVKKVFSAEEHKDMSLQDKANLFFQDYNLGPLFVQENYLQVVPHATKGDMKKTLDLISRTADCLSQTDLIERVIRTQNAWSLLSVESMFASVIPGQLMEGHFAGTINFPNWLGRNSKQNKMDRLLQELQLHMRLRISASKRALNLDYLPHIINSIVLPLRREALQGITRSLEVMDSYYLMREDLDSLLELAQWPHIPDIMNGIDGKVKAALTRAYNKDVHMTPYAVGGAKITRGKMKTEDMEGFPDEEDGAEDDDEEEDDDISQDAMIKIKKTTKNKARKQETTRNKDSQNSTSSSSSDRGRGKKTKASNPS